MQFSEIVLSSFHKIVMFFLNCEVRFFFKRVLIFF
nr:MAG TPA: hypothetical protein [Caudoviricetes sp.]